MKAQKYYPLALQVEDGCQLLVHGKKYEDGWKIDLPGGIMAICPHGKSVGVVAAPKAAIFKNFWRNNGIPT